MNKVKLSSITVAGLLLILFIGAISYGCTSNKSLNSSNGTLIKNQSTNPSQSNSNSNTISTNSSSSSQSSPNDSNINATTADNNSLLASKVNQTNQLNSLDNNHDRLRPEIIRILQAKFSDQAELKTALNGASILQDYLDRPNQDAVTMLKRYDCSLLSLTQADQNLVQSLTFDTDERQNKIKNGLKDYKPAVSTEIQIDNQGNAISPCSSIK